MTLSSDATMGEQPLLSVKAHVYHIDPKSKKSWIPATTQAVPVSFFFDSPRHLYRVISVEGTKAVINSIVTPNMTVTKTSQKFLQWSDSRVNMVYGLGFSREDDLNDFQEKFAHVKSLSQGPSSDREDDASSELGHESQQSHRSLNASVTGLVSTSSNEPGLPPNPNMIHQRSVSPGQSSVSSSNSPRPTQPITSQAVTPVMGPQGNAAQMSESQLQVENGRLREALARSCAHADKWRNQIKMLEEEKQKLLRALEESHSNLDRWKAEYAQNNRIISDNERNGSGDHAADPHSEMERLQSVVQNLEKRNRAKDSEVESLTARLEEMRTKESNVNHSTMEKLQTTESDNRALKLAISDMQEKLSRQVAINENTKAELRLIKSNLTRQVADLKKTDDKLGELLTNPSS